MRFSARSTTRRSWPTRRRSEAVSNLTSKRHILFGSDLLFAERLYPTKGEPQPALSEVFSNASTTPSIA